MPLRNRTLVVAPLRRFVPRTLDRYIGRRFIGIFIACLTLFTLIYVLVDSLSQFESFLEHSSSFAAFLQVGATYYYYQLPGLLCRLLGPVVTMASAMFTVTLTARANEFTPILATGTRVQRALLPIFALSTLLVGVTFYIQEVWIPGHRDAIRSAQAYGRGQNGIRHAIYSDPRQGLLVAAKMYHPLRQLAEGVLIRLRDGDGERIYTAAAARWREPSGGEPGCWILEDGEVQEYDAAGMVVVQPGDPAAVAAGTGPPTRASRPFHRLRFDKTTMIPQDLEGDESQAGFLTLAELARKARVSVERHRWRILYYTRFVDPFHHLVLLFLGVPVLLLRDDRNIFLSALFAVVLSAAYFVLHSVCLYLGNRQIVSPALAAWLVPMLFGSLGLTLFRVVRT